FGLLHHVPGDARLDRTRRVHEFQLGEDAVDFQQRGIADGVQDRARDSGMAHGWAPPRGGAGSYARPRNARLGASSMTQATAMPTPDNARLDRIVAEARRAAEQRGHGYRERALKMYPWICGRCAREFTRANLHELTV